ncbi:MAG: hypothetical protein U1F53_18270 [Burkholderiaceae bacterium]
MTTRASPPPSPDAHGAVVWLVRALPLLLLGLAAGRAADAAASLRASAGWHLAAGAFTLLAVACCQAGAWRVATQCLARARGAWAVKLAVVACGLLTAGLLAARHEGGQVVEMGRIALGHDPVPLVQVRLADGGRSLVLQGTLGAGSAAVVRQALQDAPWVTQVRLASAGGRLFEARAIAREIGQRGLRTHADGDCASACTVLLLAGRERSAAPGARIGFHRPQFAGVDDERWVDAQVLLAVYRAAGLGPAFVERVRRTPAGSMWFPTRDELLRNHVLTG